MMNGYREYKQRSQAAGIGREESRSKADGAGYVEKNREYALRIMEALSGVDGELLEKSSRPGAERGGRPGAGRRKIWRLARAWAAVLGIAAVGAASWTGWQLMRPGGGDNSGSAYPNEAQAPLSGEEGMYEGSMAADEDYMPEVIPGEEAEVIPQEGAVSGDAAAEDTADKAAMETIGSGQEKTDSDKKSDWENDSAENSAIEEKAAGCITVPDTDGTANFEMMLNAKEYTEEEARKLEDIGAYIPDKLPEGYVFTKAYSNPEREEPNVTVCWARGSDRIVLRLQVAEEGVATADKEKPETYDERLYEIPFGETVPANYRETFNDPVFAGEDLDLEVIESRMQVFPDSGENEVPRGNFRVLYHKNIVVSFNGQGTAEEIWEMFRSVEAGNQ